MKKKYSLLLALFGVLTINAQIGTGFEEPNGALGTQRYTDANLSDHMLINNANQPIVQHTGATELGFTSTFSGNIGTGLSDGDAVGVYEGPIDNTDILDVFPAYSSSAYLIEDPDGIITVEFDGVDLTGTTSPRFQMDLFLNSTTYESADFVKIFLKVNNGAAADFVILDTTGQDIDTFLYNGSSIEEVITNIDVDISAYVGSIVTLVLQAQSNSSAEEYLFDNILFTEGVREGTLSTVEFDNKLLFTYYPNPVNNTLRFQSEKEISEVVVFDILGQEVIKISSLVNNEVDMSNIKAGVYLVNVTIDNVKQTIKVIKE